MNEVKISSHVMPELNYMDFLVASSPFVHIDRIADFNVLIYVTDGQITVTEDETDLEINAGELLFLKSGVHHYGKREIEAGTSWYYIHFRTPACEEIPLYNASDDINTPLAHDEKAWFSALLPKKLSGLLGTETEKHIRELCEDFHNAAPLRRWSMNVKLFELLSELAFTDIKKTAAEPSLSDRISSYLSEHLTENYSSEALEKHFFLSYKYMAAVFRRGKGTTMQHYHAVLRMQYACKLLRSTMLTIGEISSRIGFSDMLYFSRCFHSYIGMSPSEYRRRVPFGS